MDLENVSDIYPLTPTQTGMLFHAVAEPDSDAYVNQVVFDVCGAYQPDQLEANIQAAMQQHEALRTAFIWEVADTPLQVVMTDSAAPHVRFDWRHLPASEQRQQLTAWVAEEKRTAFEIGAAPLVRFMSARLADDRWQFGISFHHMILDGWSVTKLAHQLLDENVSAPQPAFRFRDFVHWHQRQDSHGAMQYWQEVLRDVSPNQFAVPGRSQSGSFHAQCDATIDATLTAKLREFARGSRITLNTAFQAAWSLILNRYTGGDTDVLFGSTVSGRPLDLPGIENAIGSFINTLPCRIQISPDQFVDQWLQQIQTQQVQAMQWDFASLAEIQRLSAQGANQSLFDSILVFENYPTTGSDPTESDVLHAEHFEASNYPLALIVLPGDNLRLFLIYDTTTITSELAEGILDQVLWVLDRFGSGAAGTVRELFGLAPTQESQLIAWSESPSVAQAGSTSQDANIVDRIAASARRHPDAIAVRCGQDEITYDQMLAQTAKIATELESSGVRHGDRVAILVDRSVQTVLAILATMRVGAAYVPLDKMYPAEHLNYVLNDADVAAVLTTASDGNHLPESTKLTLDIDKLRSGDAVGHTPRTPINADALAYLIYTSGSTGRPKGVAVSHRNLLASTLARSEVYGDDPTCFLLLSSFAFDSSVAGIFWTLSTGGTLELPPPRGEQDVALLSRIMSTHGVTHLLCLPALYGVLLADMHTASFSALRCAIVAGESVLPHVADRHFEVAGQARLFNEYGPTEATVWATVYEISPSSSANDIPIGRPIPGASVYLTGHDGSLVPPGCIGEIHIGGDGVAAGYWNQPAMTDDRFVTLELPGRAAVACYRTGDLGYFRPDGQLMFCGRVDRQVKLRGYRIELSAIESELVSISNVSEASVIVQTSTHRPAQLVAFLVGAPADDKTLAGQLGERLPRYMVPASFTWLETMPRLPNGKVDVSQLPEATSSVAAASHLPPEGPVEEALYDIWRDLMRVDKFSVDDDFFALGGDSIVAIQVVSRARRQGIDIQPAQLARHPNIRALAAVAHLPQLEDTPAEMAATTTAQLSPIQWWFLSQGFENPHQWNQSQLFEIQNNYCQDNLKTAVELAAASHPLLRARLNHDNGNAHLTFSEAAVTLEDWGTIADDELEQTITGAQTSLHLTDGPVCRMGIVKTPTKNYLLLAVHHFVTDVVSQQILVDDIVFLYERLVANQPATLPVGCEFSRWTAAIAEERETMEQQLEYWHAVTCDLHCGPFTGSDSAIREQDFQSSVRCTAGPWIEALRSNANTAYNTTPHELLVTSMAMAISDMCQSDNVSMMLESHGRDHSELDVGRTVGWFTSLYPIALYCDAHDVGMCIRRCKDHMRSVPHNGRGYGGLRYLPPLSQDQPQPPLPTTTPQVLFNYLGYQPTREARLLMPVSGAQQSSRDPRSTREHLLEVVAYLDDEGLHLDLAFGSLHVNVRDVERLADRFEFRLKEIIEHCLNQRAGFTPTDFPQSELTQSELDDLLEELD